MEWTIYSVAILFLISYISFGNWEIPIKLGFDPFEIVAGFPTLIDTYYEDFFDVNSTEPPGSNLNFISERPPLPILGGNFKRYLQSTDEIFEFSDLPWNCSILESSSQCISIVSSSLCLNSSQFSYSFWTHKSLSAENKEILTIHCQYHSRYEQCEPPFQRGNICENVVLKIQKRNNSLNFELGNVEVGNQVRQAYTEIFSSPSSSASNESTQIKITCQNYTINDFVMGGEINATELNALFLFGMNYSETKQYTKRSEETCESILDTLISELSEDIDICNCPNDPICEVPILFANSSSEYISDNHQKCQIPSSVTIQIYHTHGYIYSAVVSQYDIVEISENEAFTFKKSMIFYDMEQGEPQSKYSLSRGRFHCPSEITCWMELFYPLQYFNSLELSNQLTILFFSFLISLLICL